MTERVVVTGDRYWTDHVLLENALDKVYAESGGDMILIEGEAPGADTMAREWAEQKHVTVKPYPAPWRVTPDTPPARIRYHNGHAYDVAAGPIRNQEMITDGKPTRAVAFHKNLPKSHGTLDMVQRLEKALIPIWFVPKDTRVNVQLGMAV